MTAHDVSRSALLLVTDLTYRTPGRRYGDEDVWLGSRLREHFDVALCHPLDVVALMDAFDVVVVRNSGPVLYHQAAYDQFRAAARRRGTRVYNPLTGRGDMLGKQHLVELTALGEPVIPTVDRHEDLGRLPVVDEYVVKPRRGADSIGQRVVAHEDLDEISFGDVVVQPRVDIRHEVSFVFVDDALVYATYAPDPERRWALEPYRPTAADLAFAQRFVAWNDLGHGIQRVDACRTADDDLLLVELEDLNPFLSLDLLDEATRSDFVERMVASVQAVLRTSPG